MLLDREGPTAFRGRETTARVLIAAGPYRLSGEWWRGGGRRLPARDTGTCTPPTAPSTACTRISATAAGTSMATTTKKTRSTSSCAVGRRSASSMGASLPEDLVAAAAAGGHDALALADRDGVYGAPRFFAAARKTGLRPIVGAEISLAAGAAPVLLLVEDRRGYQNLCQLITAAKSGKHKSDPVDAPRRAARRARGRADRARGRARRAPICRRCVDVFGRDRVYLEVQRHFDADAGAPQPRRAGAGGGARRRRGRDQRRPLRHARAADRARRAHLRAREGDRRRDRPPPAAQRRALAEAAAPRWRACSAICPAAVRATRDIAERCAFTLANLGYTFPDYDVPDGETQQSFLEKLSWRGRRPPLRRRRSAPAQGAPAARARARHHRSPRAGRLLPDRLGHRPVRASRAASWCRGAAPPRTPPSVTSWASPPSIRCGWTCCSNASCPRSASPPPTTPPIACPTSIWICRRAIGASW